MRRRPHSHAGLVISEAGDGLSSQQCARALTVLPRYAPPS